MTPPDDERDFLAALERSGRGLMVSRRASGAAELGERHVYGYATCDGVAQGTLLSLPELWAHVGRNVGAGRYLPPPPRWRRLYRRLLALPAMPRLPEDGDREPRRRVLVELAAEEGFDLYVDVDLGGGPFKVSGWGATLAAAERDLARSLRAAALESLEQAAALLRALSR